MRTLGTAVAAVALALVVGSSVMPAGAEAGKNGFSPADNAFVSTVLQEAQGQIVFAEFAASRATSARTRQVADETAATWTALAQRFGATSSAPAAGPLTTAQQRMLDELSQTYPSDFDSAYLRVAETDTARVLQAFADESVTGNAYLRAAVEDTTPLFQYLDRADVQE